MSLSNDELLQRIVEIESFLNNVQTALNNLATKKQLTQLVNIRQNEIIALQKQVQDLQEQIDNLKTQVG